MCGITAIISKEQGIFAFLFQSLQNLQNRGYDSAGVCGVNTATGELIVHKRASTDKATALELLQVEGENSFNDCFIGIAHTRWATHGVKNDTNSHPHVCYRGKIALVHNGIIENYDTLKADLMSKGIAFKSQTDSEVVVNMISYFNTRMSMVKAIKKTCTLMEGTWALAIVSADEHMLYVTRHGSPLILAQNDNDVVVTSEVAGLYSDTKTLTSYVSLKEKIVYAFDASSRLECEKKQIQFEAISTTPYPYKHWTLKEIHEQCTTIKRALNNGGRILDDTTVKLGGLENVRGKLLMTKHMILLGCGTSYHSAMVGMAYFKKLRTFDSVQCMDAAEFDEETIATHEDETLVVFLSQSGETRDLIKCLDICKTAGVLTLGVVNVVDSYIARETDCGIYLNAGREVGVASTKSFTSQVIILTLISVWFHQHRYSKQSDERKSIIGDLTAFANDTPKVIEQLSKYDYETLSEKFSKSSSMFVLGTKGKDTAVALEGSLKIKEISYVHCEGFNTAGLKHGPLALITDNTPVIYLMTNQGDEALTFSAVEEVKSRKGIPFLIGQHSKADLSIPTENQFGFLWNNIAIQLIAYHLSVYKGINPDMPRNLAKVVTVG